MTKHECWNYKKGKCKLGIIGTLSSDNKCPFKTRLECETAHTGYIDNIYGVFPNANTKR